MNKNQHLHSQHPDPIEGLQTTSVSEAIKNAAYNDAGIAMTPLASYKIGNQKVDTLLVSMRPGVGVAVHLHEHGGESQKSLTPVRGIFGVPQRNGDGVYETSEDGKVKFDVVQDRIYTPDDITSIPAGVVHGYGNPSRHDDAHIIFDLPHTHTTADDKLVADGEAAALTRPPTPEEQLLVARSPLVVVRADLGRIAHGLAAQGHNHSH